MAITVSLTERAIRTMSRPLYSAHRVLAERLFFSPYTAERKVCEASLQFVIRPALDLAEDARVRAWKRERGMA